MPSFCAKPQGGVAESIIQRITPALREKVFLRFLKQWILQLRAGMPFVQNDKWEAMGTDSQASVTGW